jgi:hypothetical protein
MRWVGYVARIVENRIGDEVFVGTYEGKYPCA